MAKETLDAKRARLLRKVAERKAGKRWEDNSVQFPRLIAEMEAAGAFTAGIIGDLCASMDLTVPEVMSLIDRAQATWDAAKDKV